MACLSIAQILTYVFACLSSLLLLVLITAQSMSRLSSALSAAAPALFLLASLLSLCLSFVTAAADSAAAAAPAAAAAAAATATVAKVGVTDLSGPLFLGILPPACYTAIFTDLRLDAACVKFAISKGLGYGIIAGSFLLKLPQIINILRAKSAEGMILSALYLETLSYAATSTYNLLTGTPLSTYAEALVILVQNCIIVALCWRFAATSAKHKAVTVAAAVAAVAIFLSLPPAALPALMAVSVLTSMSSRVQQIAQNFAAKSTGILSLATTVLQTGGCAARIFTTLQVRPHPNPFLLSKLH